MSILCVIRLPPVSSASERRLLRERGWGGRGEGHVHSGEGRAVWWENDQARQGQETAVGKARAGASDQRKWTCAPFFTVSYSNKTPAKETHSLWHNHGSSGRDLRLLYNGPSVSLSHFTSIRLFPSFFTKMKASLCSPWLDSLVALCQYV